MKRFVSIFSCVAALLTLSSCDWFELDNLDAWDAQVQGRIIDSKTKEPVQMEQGSAISVYELYGDQYNHTNLEGKAGWDGHSAISWLVKNNGTYVNKLTFAGKYEMDTRTNNFTADKVEFQLKKGENTVDFEVTPFCRIVDPKFTMDGKKIKASFKVETDLAGVNNIGYVRLCIYPDRFVKQSANKAANDPGAVIVDVDPKKGETITLTIDPDIVVDNVKVNADEFQYDRPHYIRIAAVGGSYSGMPAWDEVSYEIDWDNFPWDQIADDWSNFNDIVVYKEVKVHHPASYALDGKINGSGAYNYSPVFKLENGTFTEVTDW